MFCHEQAPARRVAVGWERPLHVRQTRVTLQHENAAKVAPLEPPRSPLRKTEFGQSIGARDIAESVEAIDPTSTLTRCGMVARHEKRRPSNMHRNAASSAGGGAPTGARGHSRGRAKEAVIVTDRRARRRLLRQARSSAARRTRLLEGRHGRAPRRREQSEGPARSNAAPSHTMSADEGGAQPSGAGTDSIILEEEIDPNYIPTEDEIIEYAKWVRTSARARARALSPTRVRSAS